MTTSIQRELYDLVFKSITNEVSAMNIIGDISNDVRLTEIEYPDHKDTFSKKYVEEKDILMHRFFNNKQKYNIYMGSVVRNLLEEGYENHFYPKSVQEVTDHMGEEYFDDGEAYFAFTSTVFLNIERFLENSTNNLMFEPKQIQRYMKYQKIKEAHMYGTDRLIMQQYNHILHHINASDSEIQLLNVFDI